MANGNYLKLTKPTEARSPERDALAVAIERHDNAVKALAANLVARDAAFDKKIEARKALEAANMAIEDAKESAGRYLTDQIMGTPSDAPMTIKQARDAAQEASDDLDTAVAVQATLKGLHNQIESELSYARSALDYRIRDVIRADPSIGRIVADYSRLEREFMDLRRALDWLHGHDFISNDHKGWRAERDWRDLAGATPWQAAAKALETDPDAALPIK